jgi:hypothetical protein
VKASQVVRWGCVAIAVISLLSCVVLAAIKSEGLAVVAITAIDPKKEPVDHALPLIKQKEALPDYELFVRMLDGRTIPLGAKPDSSAADGLEWKINDSICVSDIASLQLRERDLVMSDALAEVQVQAGSVTSNNYRFDFVTEPSLKVAIRSFFSTPIGMAIVGAFFLALVVSVAWSFWNGGI